jgi:hypothetical protein
MALDTRAGTWVGTCVGTVLADARKTDVSLKSFAGLQLQADMLSACFSEALHYCFVSRTMSDLIKSYRR